MVKGGTRVCRIKGDHMSKKMASKANRPILKNTKPVMNPSNKKVASKVVAPNRKMVVQTKLEKPKKVRKKIKLKYSRIFFAIVVFFVLILIIHYFEQIPISNIYIFGRECLYSKGQCLEKGID